MSNSPISATVQPITAVTPTAIDPAAAIATARRDRFPNLCETGILGRRHTGPPINPAHVVTALAFLSRCRRTRRPNVHTCDLQRHVGVSPGAIIAAGHALSFEIRSWYGVRAFSPHALMGVNRSDIRKAVGVRS
jgi:hypothetical protein